MRILFWSESFPPAVNGAAIASARLVDALRRHGHEIEVIAGAAESDPDDVPGLPIHRLPLHSPPDPERLLGVRKAVADIKERFQPDLVHVGCGSMGLHHHLATRKSAPVPSLVTVHRFWEEKFLSPESTLGRTLRDADVVVAVSHVLRDALVASIPGLDERCHVVRNIVDVAEEAGAPHTGHPHLLVLSRLELEKNAEGALEVLLQIRKLHPRTTLSMVGDGTERPRLESRARELGLGDAVTFHGWVAHHDVRAHIEASSILLVTSPSEALPLAALEAASCARPVVATEVGGMAEAVVHGETGLLAPPGDLPGLVAHLDRLIRDPEGASRMGIAGKNRVLKNFSEEHCLCGYERLYTGLFKQENAHADRGQND